MIHANTNRRMMFLTDIEKRNQLALDLLKFCRVFLFRILKMFERAARINIIARINAYLLTIQSRHISRVSRKVYISDKWCQIALGLQLCRYILHVLCLTGSLRGKTHQFAACINNPLSLRNTSLGIISIHRTHRLDTNRIRASDAYLSDSRL